MKNKKKSKISTPEYSFELSKGEDPRMALTDARFYTNNITWQDLQKFNKGYGNDIDHLFPGFATTEQREVYIPIH